MASIRFWQERLGQVYPNREKGPDYMMAHAYTACSDLGRLLLRHEKDPRRESAVISALSWLLALSNHFGIDYEGALARRFPAACPYCLRAPCHCDRTGRTARHGNGRAYTELEAQDELQRMHGSIVNAGVEISWTWFVDQLASIYPSNRSLLARGGEAYVVGKMLEEGGELHRAYSEYLLGAQTKHDIEIELADLSAWVISCWDLDGIGKDLGAEIASLYAAGCFRCKSPVCRCPTYSITMSQEDLVRRIASQLRSLQENGLDTPDVAQAIKTADDAKVNPTPEAKRSLMQKVKGVLSLVKGADEGATALHHVGQELGTMAGMLEERVP